MSAARERQRREKLVPLPYILVSPAALKIAQRAAERAGVTTRALVREWLLERLEAEA